MVPGPSGELVEETLCLLDLSVQAEVLLEVDPRRHHAHRLLHLPFSAVRRPNFVGAARTRLTHASPRLRTVALA